MTASAVPPAVPSAAAEGAPDVTVMIPAHNAMPYLVRCLDSVEAQTIGLDRIEILIVDDGSTDGTGEEVDRRAAARPDVYRVVHQPASGGPAAPRNRGIELARGRYLYFVDADDHIGPEALERLLATADAEDSDIVLGKMLSETRGVPASMFRQTQLDVDLFDSRIYWSLTCMKLMRRELLVEHGIRFPTHFPNWSDQPFTALAYLRARKISVLADYDFYWLVLRDDGLHVTRTGSISTRLDVVEEMCALLAREVPDPDRRALLLSRHFGIDLRRVVRSIAALTDRSEQEPLLARVAVLVTDHLNEQVQQRLTADLRVIYHLAGRGLVDETVEAVRFDPTDDRPWDVVVEDDGRVLARLPFLRDASLGVPDALYDVTDRIRLQQTLSSYDWAGTTLRLTGALGWRRTTAEPGDVVEVALRHRGDDTVHVVPGQRTEGDGFTAELDLLTVAGGAPLAPGLWDVELRLRRGSLVSTVRCALPEDGGLERRASLHHAVVGAAAWTVASFVTLGGRLALDVGQRKHRIGKALRDWRVALDGDVLVAEVASDLLLDAPLSLVLRGADGERSWPVTGADGRYVARVPLADLPAGTWALRFRVGEPPAHQGFPVPAAATTGGSSSTDDDVRLTPGPDGGLQVVRAGATGREGLLGRVRGRLRR